MITRSTIKLLRIPFSFFLSPVYFFALSQLTDINWFKALLIFVILHLLIYPASNGYNSLMDRDTASIGGLEKPPLPSRDLFVTTMVLDAIGIIASSLVGWAFTLVMILYVAASKAYSYRGIRLKKYPYIGYLIVVVFQGAVTFWLVYKGSDATGTATVPWPGLVISSLLVGGFYPLTQIYQHKQDKEDGVETISYKLGYTGTFVFCTMIYLLAWILLAQFLMGNGKTGQLVIIGVFFAPVVFYFLRWFGLVYKNTQEANFKNTMKMNWTAATFTNISFIISLFVR